MKIFDGSAKVYDLLVSVLDFGAKGDGVTDDSTSIQAALDYAQNGGVVVFPAGVYLIATPVLFYSNQLLLMTGATIKQGAAINNLMRSYCESSWTGYTGTHDTVIYGGTFDGGSYSTNNTLLGMAHCRNIRIEGCTFKNAYGTWHDLEINSSNNVKIINCDFEGTRKTGANGEMIQIDGAAESGDYPWSGVNYDGTVSKYIEIAGCAFHDTSYVPGIGNHHDLAHQFISIHDCIFAGISTTRGAIDFTALVTDVDIANNIFNTCTTGVKSSGASYFIRGNRFCNVTTGYAGSSSIAHDNIINGVFVA